MTTRTIIATTLALGLLAACGAPQVILPGPREDIRPAEPEAARASPLALPAPVAQADWTHRYGSPAHRTTHPALGPALAPLFTAEIGAGESRRARITADPVVANGAIFTLDARARVTATGTDGRMLWSRDVTPPQGAGSLASGGGLAVAGGRLFVSTGYGTLVALDAASGAPIWTHDLDAPGGSPTVRDGLVYVVAGDSRAWAIDAASGRVAWQRSGTTSLANFAGGAGVAVAGDTAVLPFPSAEVTAVFARGGLPRWTAQVAGSRPGQAAGEAVTDIAGDPVIDGARVYVGNATGRLVALDLATGDRIWTATEGATSPVWPVGGAVFLVNDLNQLVRLDAATGRPVWRTALPGFVEEDRREALHVHYGPVLAGGRLIVASSDGVLRQFDPVSGAPLAEVALPGGAATHPAVAGGTLYVVNRQGQLLAFR